MTRRPKGLPRPAPLLDACCILVALSCLMLSGCRSGTGMNRAAPPPVDGFPAHLKVENRAMLAERIVVRVDGRTVFDATLSPRGVATPGAVPLSRGWHRVSTSGSSGLTHQALVTGDQEQWLLIRRDPRKAEGFGIHVTGRPN